jgi:hypothetical protein
MQTRRAIAALITGIVALLAIAACGGSSDASESTPTTSEQASDESVSPSPSAPAAAVEEPNEPLIDETTERTSTVDEIPTTISVGDAPDEGADPPSEPTPEPVDPPTQEIVIENGEPIGGVARIEGKKGDTIAFAVRSDIPEAVHVHGFDVTKNIDPRSATKFKFKAEFEGIFEVEAHHAGNIVIAKVVVSP